LDSKLKLNFMSFQVTTMNQCDVKWGEVGVGSR
jgi:hypothetical protein